MIYYSHRTRKALAEGRIFLPLGFAHYSYGTVCRKFLELFESSDIPTQELMMPEIYPTAAHVFPPSPSARPLHLAFKPFDEIRLLKGAANVAHVAWEFDRLPQLSDLPHNHPRRRNIMNDYVHVLGLQSEVWVGCSYTKQVFEAHGLTNVEVVPAPIVVNGAGRPMKRAATTSLRRIDSLALTQQNVAAYVERSETSALNGGTLFRADDCSARDGRVFLSIFNPGDPRKNAASLLLGFQDFLLRTRRNDLLIIKLVLDGSKDSFRDALLKGLPKHFDELGVPFYLMDCPNILLVPGRLSEEELDDLYQASDFYLCASGAEGQGLPVQEAMATGLVPISSRETAMGDYVDESNGLVMRAVDAPIPLQVSEAYGLMGLTWRVVNHQEIARALAAAVELSTTDYAQRSQAAVDRIRGQYGYDCVTSRVLARLEALSA